MRRAPLLAAAVVALTACSASAQTSTSTASGVRFRSQRLDQDLRRWESGDKGGADVFDAPFAQPGAAPAAPPSAPPPGPGAAPAPSGFDLGGGDAPGGARVDVPGEPRLAVPAAPAPGAAQGLTFDRRLYDEGQAQRSLGKGLLIGGISGAALGTVMGLVGYSRALSGDAQASDALLVLGGLGVGGAGAGLIVAGSIMMHRGGKKMDKAQGVRLGAVGPLLMQGDLRGAQASFTF